jgi:hypothetical protein
MLANEQTGSWRAALLLTAGGNLWQDLQKQGTSCKLDLELADTVAALVKIYAHLVHADTCAYAPEQQLPLLSIHLAPRW